MAIEAGTITADVKAKITIRVGEHDIDLVDVAQALTRAGLELQALVDPPTQRLDTTTYTGKPRTEEASAPAAQALPRAGEALVRDESGALHLVRLRGFVYLPHAGNDRYPPVSIVGALMDTITE
jgi:hypothetical protein